MNTLIAGLLALATLGGTAAIAADCTDLAGQGTLCATVDPNSGADASVTIDPQPPVAGAAAPTCQDVAGQADVCHEIVADPASGVSADVSADVHPTPPIAGAAASAAPTCQDLAGQGSACYEVDPANGVATVAVTVDPQPPQ